MSSAEFDYSFSRPVPVAALRSLLDQTDWASGRTEDELMQLIASTPVQLGAWDGTGLWAMPER